MKIIVKHEKNKALLISLLRKIGDDVEKMEILNSDGVLKFNEYTNEEIELAQGLKHLRDSDIIVGEIKSV